MPASLARQPAALRVAAIGFVIGILLYIGARSRHSFGPEGVTFGRPPPPPPPSRRPPPLPPSLGGGEDPEVLRDDVEKGGNHDDGVRKWGGLFVPGAKLPEAGKYGESMNLVDEKDGSYYGPWKLDYSSFPRTFTAQTNHTFTFICTYHIDLCPKRYSLYLRGPALLTPDPYDFKSDPSNPRQISVTVSIPDPGVYTLYAWPDYDECPAWWKNLNVPFYRAQVVGTPLNLTVSGPSEIEEGFNSCSLDDAKHLTHGRWIHRPSLAPEYKDSQWSKSYPETTDFAFQPYNCKRQYRSPRILSVTSKISSVVVLGDSTSRGSFCRLLGRPLTESDKVSDSCTYRKGDDWLQEPKSFMFRDGGGREIPFEFRFLTHGFADSFSRVKASLPVRPSHIVTNLGLWMTFVPRERYKEEVRKYLRMLHDAWPDVTVIWRTTTDISPMVNCFGMTNMYRDTMSEQRGLAMKVIEELRNEWQDWRVYVVDAWAMTAPRQETALDGRHWVFEDPEEEKVVKLSRPRVNEAEEGVVQAIVEVLVLDNERAVKEGRQVNGTLTEQELRDHEREMRRQEKEKKEKERKKNEEEAEQRRKEEEEARKKKEEEAKEQQEEAKKKEDEAKKKEEEARKARPEVDAVVKAKDATEATKLEG